METTIYPAFDVNSPTLVSFILEDNPEPKEDVKEIFQRFHLLRKKEMRCVLVRKTQSVDKFLEDFERRIAIRKAREKVLYNVQYHLPQALEKEPQDSAFDPYFRAANDVLSLYIQETTEDAASKEWTVEQAVNLTARRLKQSLKSLNPKPKTAKEGEEGIDSENEGRSSEEEACLTGSDPDSLESWEEEEGRDSDDNSDSGTQDVHPNPMQAAEHYRDSDDSDAESDSDDGGYYFRKKKKHYPMDSGQVISSLAEINRVAKKNNKNINTLVISALKLLKSLIIKPILRRQCAECFSMFDLSESVWREIWYGDWYEDEFIDGEPLCTLLRIFYPPPTLASTTAINRLPIEILRLIFQLGSDFLLAPFTSRDSATIRYSKSSNFLRQCSLVCQRWRHEAQAELGKKYVFKGFTLEMIPLPQQKTLQYLALRLGTKEFRAHLQAAELSVLKMLQQWLKNGEKIKTLQVIGPPLAVISTALLSASSSLTHLVLSFRSNGIGQPITIPSSVVELTIYATTFSSSFGLDSNNNPLLLSTSSLRRMTITYGGNTNQRSNIAPLEFPSVTSLVLDTRPLALSISYKSFPAVTSLQYISENKHKKRIRRRCRDGSFKHIKKLDPIRKSIDRLTEFANTLTKVIVPANVWWLCERNRLESLTTGFGIELIWLDERGCQVVL